MNKLKLAFITLLSLGLAAPVYAARMGGYDFTLVQGTEPSATPTPVPTATPTASPTPAPGAPVDPNATQTTKNELGLLDSLEGASSHHILLGSSVTVRSCSSNGCATDDSQSYSGNGNQYYGLFGVDMCNEDWGAVGQPMCVFGTGSDAYNQAVYAWNTGSIVMMSMDPPNPITGYTNPGAAAAGSATTPCSGSARAGQSGDCTGIAANFSSLITQNGNSYNTNFNTLLNNWVSTFLALQNDGITLLFRPYQEEDLGWAWWNLAALSGSQEAQLYQYTEDYFESQGVHNLLYVYTIYGAVPSGGYPGNNYVDILGFDFYGGPQGLPSSYSNVSGYGKPVIVPELNCSSSSSSCDSSTDYDDYEGEFSGGSQIVGMSLWLGVNPGYAYSNSSWTSLAQNAYMAMAGSFGFGGLP